jgi:hypothetical protein
VTPHTLTTLASVEKQVSAGGVHLQASRKLPTADVMYLPCACLAVVVVVVVWCGAGSLTSTVPFPVPASRTGW